MAIKKRSQFDPKVFLSVIGAGRTILSFQKKQTIYSQGDLCGAVFYVQKGKVKLTVVSDAGKEAIVGTWSDGDFFGEGGLVGQLKRIGTASAMTECTLMRIEEKEMRRTLDNEPALSKIFVAHLLSRNIRYEEDLVDQLFNSSEKRLARVLLLLARFGKDGLSQTTDVGDISQETLAEMVGTTRSRVSFFMNKFRRLGFVDYNGGLIVHSSLLNVVLHD
jgi:CRP/FNR family transcriptional regulator, cyclic AMP receptor protein